MKRVFPTNAIETQQRLSKLRQYPFFQIEVRLESACNLLAKDSGGTSDPYVKFKIGNKVVYKSRCVQKCLNPQWDETFTVRVDDVFQPLCIKVYDHDFGFQDDYLGGITIDLKQLEFNVATSLTLDLTDAGTDVDEHESWGQISLTISLIPKTQEEKEQHYERGSRTIAGSGETAVKRLKTQLWDSVVNIVLVEGKGLSSKDENGFSDPYVKFKLGTERYKSKVVNKSLNPQWNEQFDLHTFPDQSKVLEVSVYDKDFHGKDDFMGKFAINLNNLPKEETLKIWKKLEGGEGSVLLLLTISGTLGAETISDLNKHEPTLNQLLSLKNRYVCVTLVFADFSEEFIGCTTSLWKTFQDVDDIGQLSVKVFKAEGLLAADFSGKSDPFCVIELVNARLQTNTEYKTLCPEWNKIFSFRVYDVHEILEITVYDEDRDKKVEFLGKVAIPLLKIRNGEKRWYTLKDKKLRSRSKGRILLELSLVFNPVRACIRTFNPKEVKFVQTEQKFKRSVFVKNVSRLKALLMEFIEIAKFINSCFQWESVPRSICALIIFMLITYFFQLYMVPIILLLIFLKNYLWVSCFTYFNNSAKEDEVCLQYFHEEKKTLKEKFQTVQEVTAMVQNVLGEIASLGERVKNTFDFSVPFLSFLAIFCLCLGTFVLYHIPLRYLIMLWGLNKFTKKLRSPNAIPNNEVLDFLSRVPDNDEKIMHKEFRDESNQSPQNETAKKAKKKNA
ncbi:multiple C2 and transmembrane domain-containing protein 1-like protein [Leptotrombidium deliense]|uniref:Multiple C2 and transmembrane domain-containing protein 1-like protein n=1 Tax=Leptotrombidium deliense TaxID=299467 RepID=A0A443SLC3_9ACAR|nr:multiple C2 and transmembrane domain-containing protein 1-like protein [Leptotrombidium deliense]